MKKIITHISLFAVVLHAGAASGAGNLDNTGTNPGNLNNTSGVSKLSLEGVVAYLARIMNSLVYVIVGAALVMFLYGILKLSFIDGQKPESREQSRKFMMWGIVSLFVMVSVWGLVKILQATVFGGSPLLYPQLK
jgi:hypothetical protein